MTNVNEYGINFCQLFSECPASFPNVYYHGNFCCKSKKEKVYTPQGTKCDGSLIQRDSLCCEGDQWYQKRPVVSKSR